MDQVEEKIFLARVAEQAERYEDMVGFLEEAISQKNGEDFTIDERNLLKIEGCNCTSCTPLTESLFNKPAIFENSLENSIFLLLIDHF